jgi:hypothetical protein
MSAGRVAAPGSKAGETPSAPTVLVVRLRRRRHCGHGGHSGPVDRVGQSLRTVPRWHHLLQGQVLGRCLQQGRTQRYGAGSDSSPFGSLRSLPCFIPQPRTDRVRSPRGQHVCLTALGRHSGLPHVIKPRWSGASVGVAVSLSPCPCAVFHFFAPGSGNVGSSGCLARPCCLDFIIVR